MNKELIKKYKAEFDHWLNGGKVLMHYGNRWIFVTLDAKWEFLISDLEKMGSFGYVIDDEYVEFRKALAEGKTVQEQDYFNKQWLDMKTDDFHGASYTRYEGVYRIKPDEPKFKIGDWITDGIEVWQHKENCRVKNQTSWNLWQPKPGEWCWVFNKLRGVPVLRRVIKVEGNFKNRFNDEKFTKTVRVSRGDYLGDEVGYRFCEPFIGQLPTILKDYK